MTLLSHRSLRRGTPIAIAFFAASSCTFGDFKKDSPPVTGDAGTADSSVDSGGPVVTVDPALRANVVAALATNVVFAATQDFQTAAEALATATAAFAAAPADTTARDTARDAWRAAMVAMQRLELMQLGPVAHPSAAIAGEGWRDEYYAWPLLGRCEIDRRIVAGTYAPVTLGAAPFNERGMAALEELLFDVSASNSCSSFDAINADGTWAALADRNARRASYAASAAELVLGEATRLRTKWDPAGGNFAGTLATAGSSGSPYPNSQEALNALSNAMFYLDTVTKDMKVATPAGLSLNCTEPSCPDAVESALSDHSLANIRANLVGFRLLLTGGDGDALGFDDLLVSIDQGVLATTMTTEIDQAIATVDGITVALEVLVDSDPDTAHLLYDELKNITDLLKTQFLAVLDLDRPMSAAGDND